MKPPYVPQEKAMGCEREPRDLHPTATLPRDLLPARAIKILDSRPEARWRLVRPTATS